MLKCNNCGQSCRGWDAFRMHNLRFHKENEFLNNAINDHELMNVDEQLHLSETDVDTEEDVEVYIDDEIVANSNIYIL